jgi:hypothetical protein
MIQHDINNWTYQTCAKIKGKESATQKKKKKKSDLDYVQYINTFKLNDLLNSTLF